MTPDFDEAVTRFKKFVEEQGQPPRLMWVRSEDVLVADNRWLYVRVGVPEQNEKLARNAYEKGRRGELGVVLATLCQLQDMTCCYVWAPADEDQAERLLMPTDLKLSVSSGEYRWQGKTVSNTIHWLWLRWRYRKNQKQKAWWFE